MEKNPRGEDDAALFERVPQLLEGTEQDARRIEVHDSVRVPRVEQPREEAGRQPRPDLRPVVEKKQLEEGAFRRHRDPDQADPFQRRRRRRRPADQMNREGRPVMLPEGARQNGRGLKLVGKRDRAARQLRRARRRPAGGSRDRR